MIFQLLFPRLLFSLFIPFMEVLFHTFMDNLRVEVNRPINHHGRTVIPSVPSTAAEAPATPTSTSAEGNSNSAGRGEVKSQKEGKLIQVIPMEQQKSDSLERNVNLVDRYNNNYTYIHSASKRLLLFLPPQGRADGGPCPPRLLRPCHLRAHRLRPAADALG